MEMQNIGMTQPTLQSINNHNYVVSIENKAESNRLKIGILGTGNYGTALATQFLAADLNVRAGSRQPSKQLLQGHVLQSYDEVITGSDIIFLCIPPHAYDSILKQYESIFIGKTVVEISNLEKVSQSSNALLVQSLLPSSHVIKALNTVSAYVLENDAYGASRDTYVCGDHEEKKSNVMQVLREIGLNPHDRGGLRSAVMIEKLPFRFFKGWGTALLITFIALFPIMLYTYLRFFWHDTAEERKSGVGLRTTNITIAWLMNVLLALVFLPGVIAGYLQIFAGTKYLRFPKWLDTWMKCRKELGLICLLLASVHGCLSCLSVGGGESIYMLGQIRVAENVIYQGMDFFNESSMILAAFSLGFMAVLGITSLPSVNNRMSWKEWDFIQRGVGFLSLLLGTLHGVLLVQNIWDGNYPFGIKKWERHENGLYPPAAFVAPMFPLLVIFFKVILMLPGVSCYLFNIRKGKIGNKK